MASLPTGSHRLSAQPAMLRVNPRDFEVDVEGIANAATAPVRVADAIETFSERQRARAIDKDTFDARRRRAINIAESAANREPGVQQIADIRTQGELGRAGGEEEFRARTVERDLTEFGAESAAREAERGLRTASARAGTQQQEIIGEDLTTNRGVILDTQNLARQNAFGAQQVAGVETTTKFEDLTGVPETRLVDQPDGSVQRVRQTVPSTGGEAIVRERTDLESPAQARAREANAFALNQNRLAQATLRNAQAKRAGEERFDVEVSTVYDDYRVPIGVQRRLVDPATKQIVSEQIIDLQPSATGLRSGTSAQAPAAAPAPAPAASAPMDLNITIPGSASPLPMRITPTGPVVNPNVPIGSAVSINGQIRIYTGGELIFENTVAPPQ